MRLSAFDLFSALNLFQLRDYLTKRPDYKFKYITTLHGKWADDTSLLSLSRRWQNYLEFAVLYVYFFNIVRRRGVLMNVKLTLSLDRDVIE